VVAVIRPFRRQKPAPLLSDAEMAKLHEEIFEEPVSVERLFEIYDRAQMMRAGHLCEWVMDQSMLNRIRRLLSPTTSSLFTVDLVRVGMPEQLIGLPIAIEPFAKLAIRERVS
jgi:hypothetical protein